MASSLVCLYLAALLKKGYWLSPMDFCLRGGAFKQQGESFKPGWLLLVYFSVSAGQLWQVA